MGFIEAIRICFEKYVTISGRARRSEYWWWVLFTFLGNAVFGLLDEITFGGGASIFGALFALVTLLPTICVAGRRLHDRDMSAWWLLLVLIPVIGSLILLVIFLFRGTEGPNRFGPDPLGGGGSGWQGDSEGGQYERTSIPRAGHDN